MAEAILNQAEAIVAGTIVTGRPQRSSGEDGCLTAALVAFAQDSVPGADRSHWTALSGGRWAAQAGSPFHTAEMTALVLLAMTAGSRAVVAGSRAAAGSAR